MPRVVFLGYPLRGHTAPTLPVVAELVRRGAEVDYYTEPRFAPLVESAGARFVAYPAGCAGLDQPADTDEHWARGLAAADALLPPLLNALEQRPELVMFDSAAIWGAVVARRLRLPSVASITTFAFSRSMLQMLRTPAPAPWSDAAFARLNSEHGASFRDHLDAMVPIADLKLVYTSRAFQPAGRLFDPSYLFVGPLLDQRPRDGVRARGEGSRPLAYVSLGTVFNRDHALLRTISQTLADGGWQVIVSLGGDEAELDWPEHVQAHAFVDQIGVLGQAQLFVTHGGMNSVSEALSQAAPMIIIPHAVDQPIVAKQTANLGAAVVIEPDAVSAETLSAALARIHADRAAFERSATALQRSFAETTPLNEAVDQVLTLIAPGTDR